VQLHQCFAVNLGHGIYPQSISEIVIRPGADG
jgi:hypothetical protein